MSKEKAKGDAFERAVAAVFRMNGHPRAERVLRLGAHEDHGDIGGVESPPTLRVLVDCKNHARHELARWMDETVREAEQQGRVAVVVAKRRGKTAEHAFAIMELEDLAALLALYSQAVTP